MAYEALTVQQNDMITMLIEGEGVTDIAKKLGVARQTIYNWSNKDNIKAEIDRRRRELANQGNRIILKDITTYIGNIKELANDNSDKRVCLAANQYLINRVYGNPTNNVEIDNNADDNSNVDNDTLQAEINKFKGLKKVK